MDDEKKELLSLDEEKKELLSLEEEKKELLSLDEEKKEFSIWKIFFKLNFKGVRGLPA